MNRFQLDVTLLFRDSLPDGLLGTLSVNNKIKVKGFNEVEFQEVIRHGEVSGVNGKYFVELKDRVYNFETDNVSDVYIHLNTTNNNRG